MVRWVKAGVLCMYMAMGMDIRFAPFCIYALEYSQDSCPYRCMVQWCGGGGEWERASILFYILQYVWNIRAKEIAI